MKLIIYGAGGHAKVVGEAAYSLAIYEKIIFIDPFIKKFIFTQHNPKFSLVSSYSILGIEPETHSFCAIGDNAIREKVVSDNSKDNFIYIASNEAYISKFCDISPGAYIAPRASVNADASIGFHSIINTGSVVEHDCKINSFCHIGPNAALGGNVSLGDKVFIGGNAFINPNISICSDVTIGSGSVVTKNINEPGVYVGSPVTKIT
ncbi:acetyltransferase [Gammaproteobacteria bacterium]|jgi:acetyltransferase EpsM|nr:acetyltransferase [Gammaproteobacteria bacterium]MDA9175241.1 acetyltransferase [Gammaproteobacteria bacterium]MDA9834589.1 acetyltransferase [Gammaproteobacteria bacterium]MDA9979408.1 acetyltransferase [Gammaproteobacteria bacterium]MDC3371995.1 acetyltransferase [Gammaproteobacteria bacterium]